MRNKKIENTWFGICLMVLFTSLASISLAQTEPGEPKPQYIYKGVSDNACAVEVAFGSYGAGIDGGALEKITALIAKRKVQSTTKPIGREGEIRICLPLTELSKRKRNAFINELTKIAKQAQLVSVSIR